MVLIHILWSCWGFIFLWDDPGKEHEASLPLGLHGDEKKFNGAMISQSPKPRISRMRMERQKISKVVLERGRS